jgi:hypothetical protein
MQLYKEMNNITQKAAQCGFTRSMFLRAFGIDLDACIMA